MALTLTRVGQWLGNADSGQYWTGVTDATAAAAQNVYCGFIPNYIEVWNTTDGLYDYFKVGMTAATTRQVTMSTGADVANATNGVTLLTGTEAVPASTLIALGTNGASGPGFTIGTFPLVASKSYIIRALR